MDIQTLLIIIKKCDHHISAINAIQDVDALSASDHGRLWAFEEMRDTLLQYVEDINKKEY